MKHHEDTKYIDFNKLNTIEGFHISPEKTDLMSLKDFKKSLGMVGENLSDQELMTKRDLFYGFGYSIYQNWRTSLKD